MGRVLFLAGAALAVGAGSAATAREARPDYLPLRYDEDWRALCAGDRPVAPLDRLKCVPLGDAATLTVGGDLRARIELADRPGFGLKADRDHALLARALAHADLRVGDGLRAFVQLGFMEQTGRVGGPSPNDVDRGDLMQGFVDLSAPLAGGLVTLRAGRQEVMLGSSRIVSFRDGPNVRRAFDGVRGFWTSGGYRVDALYLAPVAIGPAAFDDRAANGERLGGIYASGPVPGLPLLKGDFYWLDYRRDRARFAAGVADERRRTVGFRLFGKASGFDWDVEGVYQWGRFGARPISAWTLASNVGLTLAALPASPRIGLKADVASGDRGGGGRGRLGTFNALYPKLPYFSEANLVAPANVVDLHPEVSFSLTRALRPYVGFDVLWRATIRDAVYARPLVPIAGTAARGGRSIGDLAIAGLDWQATRRVGLAAQYVRFAPGRTMRFVGGRSGDYLTTSVGYRF